MDKVRLTKEGLRVSFMNTAPNFTTDQMAFVKSITIDQNTDEAIFAVKENEGLAIFKQLSLGASIKDVRSGLGNQNCDEQPRKPYSDVVFGADDVPIVLGALLNLNFKSMLPQSYEQDQFLRKVLRMTCGLQ